MLPSTPSVAPPASAKPQVDAASAAGAEPQVDNEFQVRTLASFRCEGSFAFLQRVGGGFLGLAHEIAQNSVVLVGLAGDRLAFSQDNQETRASCLTAKRSPYVIYISMHKLHVICLNMNRYI